VYTLGYCGSSSDGQSITYNYVKCALFPRHSNINHSFLIPKLFKDVIAQFIGPALHCFVRDSLLHSEQTQPLPVIARSPDESGRRSNLARV